MLCLCSHRHLSHCRNRMCTTHQYTIPVLLQLLQISLQMFPGLQFIHHCMSNGVHIIHAVVCHGGVWQRDKAVKVLPDPTRLRHVTGRHQRGDCTFLTPERPRSCHVRWAQDTGQATNRMLQLMLCCMSYFAESTLRNASKSCLLMDEASASTVRTAFLSMRCSGLGTAPVMMPNLQLP